jgi:hypothetical protein
MGTARVEIGRWEEADSRSAPALAEEVRRLEALAWLLDSSIPIPGTRLRIGLDPIIGLIPVVGDLIGMLFSAYILVRAARLGIPRVTLMRMGFNVTLETVVGIVPIVGDAFDFWWQANRKNVELLKAHVRDPGRARRGDWLFAMLFLIGAAALLFLLGGGGMALGRALAGLIAG